MSRTDDAELKVGLGWEVWFLLALLAGGAIAALVTMMLLGAGLDVPTAPHVATITREPDLDPRRMLAGLTGSVVCVAVATVVIRTTDWQGSG